MSTPTIAGALVPAKRAADLQLSQRAKVAVLVFGAIVVVLCFLHFGLSGRALVGALFGAVLVYLAAFDLEHRLIPNRVVLPAAAIVLAAQIVLYPNHSVEWLTAAACAAGFFFVTLLLYPPGLGMGDVKLALLLGAALGTNVVGAVLVGTVAAAVFGGVLVLRGGPQARKMAIAFGPFLALGGIVALLLS
jgi:prepilin signal peptidase PulO-like enzyme (type II secretory pathway)